MIESVSPSISAAPLGDAPLGVAVDVVLHMHVEVRNVGIGRTRAAVHLI